MTHSERGVAFGSINLGRVVEPFDTLGARGLDEDHQRTELGIAQIFHSLTERDGEKEKQRVKEREKERERRHHNKEQVQWNLTITATYGPNISGCYIEVAALHRCKCIESYHLGLD